jgi:Flp pilus assembly protein TadD
MSIPHGRRPSLALWLPRLVPVAAVVVSFYVFLPALSAGFVNWDDEASFLENPSYRGLGPRQLWWMLTTTRLGHWSPVAWVTWGLDYALWGLAPAGYHFTSLVLHAVAAGLFVVLARQLIAAGFSAAAPASAVAGGALLAALVWGVHPLRTESVAWVSGRRDVLCGLLSIAAVLAYLRGVRAGGPIERRWWGISILLYAGALGSKAIAITLPLSLLVLDAYPLRRLGLGRRALILEKVPYAVLAAGAAVMAVVARQDPGNITSYGDYGIGARIALAGYTFWFYPSRFVWPVELSPMYELPAQVSLAQLRFLVPLLAVIAMTVVLVRLRHRWPAGLAAWAHSAIVLLPVSGFVHSGYQLAYDRYSYLSGMGFSILVGAGLTWALADEQAPARRRILAPAAAALIVITLGVASWVQAGVWSSSETLWRRATLLDPACSICVSNLGRALARPGRLLDAEAYVRRAIALRPDRPGPHENMAVIATMQGRHAEAEAEFRKVVAIRPSHGSSRNNLAVAMANQGRYAEAEKELREAARLGPTLIDPPANLGALYVRQGRHAEAIPLLRQALERDPSRASTRANLIWALSGEASALEAAGKSAEAAKLSQEAVALRSR